ncbi:MAG: hypothetical protein CVV27_13875 [Candidatus Melainabacteria bacterium HGW-Melainabacteria-1]|nr:MAG: hypothetical protein CVV27_13875 [Candidatus Melainabacteria bacterium HGW-Melainabacteria-1]
MEPDNFWVRIQVANLYQQSEFAYHEREQPKQATEALERAKTHYRKALEIYPRYTHGYVHLARVHESLGEPDTARELLDQALVIDPEAPYIWIETGRMYARQKQHARAIEAFEHAAALIASRSEPQGLHSMLDYSLAEAYLATHQPDKALPLLESLRANPGFASVAEMRLLEFYRDRKDYAKALELYASLFSREPASKQEPYYARGYRQTWLLAQLQSRPNAPELLNDLGQLAQEEGNEQAAADYFQRALAADPAHPVIRYNLGSLYLTQQQPALALPHLQAALSQQPRYPKAAYNLALVYIALGQPEQAKPLLQQVLSWEPGHAEARQTLSALTR